MTFHFVPPAALSFIPLSTYSSVPRGDDTYSDAVFSDVILPFGTTNVYRIFVRMLINTTNKAFYTYVCTLYKCQAIINYSMRVHVQIINVELYNRYVVAHECIYIFR